MERNGRPKRTQKASVRGQRVESRFRGGVVPLKKGENPRKLLGDQRTNKQSWEGRQRSKKNTEEEKGDEEPLKNREMVEGRDKQL